MVRGFRTAAYVGMFEEKECARKKRTKQMPGCGSDGLAVGSLRGNGIAAYSPQPRIIQNPSRCQYSRGDKRTATFYSGGRFRDRRMVMGASSKKNPPGDSSASSRLDACGGFQEVSQRINQPIRLTTPGNWPRKAHGSASPVEGERSTNPRQNHGAPSPAGQIQSDGRHLLSGRPAMAVCP